MPRLNVDHPAEELLCAEKLIERRSVQRRAILGCIGCRWLKAAEAGEDARVYGLEIVRCTGIKSGVAYPLLKALSETGVMIGEREDINLQYEGRPPRKYYYPTDSELGEAFWNSLEIPAVCDFETE
jgi:hypothetical protein